MYINLLLKNKLFVFMYVNIPIKMVEIKIRFSKIFVCLWTFFVKFKS